MKIFVRRKSKHSSKGNKLPISRMTRECECYTSSRVLEKEFVHTCTPADYNSFNIHAWKATQTALLEAERKKAEALMERQKRPFIC